MPKRKPISSPLDHPLIWRGLIKRLSTIAGADNIYATMHDAMVIQEFCDAFEIPLSAVSGRLETYVHAPNDAVN